MARLHIQPSQISGTLDVQEVHPNCTEVYFLPPREALKAEGYDEEKIRNCRKSILLFSGQDDFVSISPINTLIGHSDFLMPKYNQVESITLEGFGYGSPDTPENVMAALEDLPSGFIKDFDYGLGLLKDLRFIIDAIEEIDSIKHVCISETKDTKIDGEIFILNYKHYDALRRKLNATSNRGQNAIRIAKSITAHNVLSHFLDAPEYPQKTFPVKNDRLSKIIIEGKDADLSNADQQVVVNLVAQNTKAIAEASPDTLIKLHNDIELVTLAELINKFESMLGKRLSERDWQKLFNDNPFILNLAFGFPVIKIKDQAHVGGRKIDGSGDKISDFLVKNGMNNNAALFEIKTPSTKLLNAKPYREEVFTPSAELAGAINQLLDQKQKFLQEIATIKVNSRMYDLEAYSVHGVLVVGTTPDGPNKQKSFELFRGNSKDIAIITFDELLAKLKLLHAFLASNKDEATDT